MRHGLCVGADVAIVPQVPCVLASRSGARTRSTLSLSIVAGVRTAKPNPLSSLTSVFSAVVSLSLCFAPVCSDSRVRSAPSPLPLSPFLTIPPSSGSLSPPLPPPLPQSAEKRSTGHIPATLPRRTRTSPPGALKRKNTHTTRRGWHEAHDCNTRKRRSSRPPHPTPKLALVWRAQLRQKRRLQRKTFFSLSPHHAAPSALFPPLPARWPPSRTLLSSALPPPSPSHELISSSSVLSFFACLAARAAPLRSSLGLSRLPSHVARAHPSLRASLFFAFPASSLRRAPLLRP